MPCPPPFPPLGKKSLIGIYTDADPDCVHSPRFDHNEGKPSQILYQHGFHRCGAADNKECLGVSADRVAPVDAFFQFRQF